VNDDFTTPYFTLNGGGEEGKAAAEGLTAMSVLRSRNARPGKDEEGAAMRPPCSQNAHDKTVLVRYAQSRAALATPLKRSIENWRALAQATAFQ